MMPKLQFNSPALRGYHSYHQQGVWRTDSLEVYGRKAAYEALGVVAVAVLLNPERDSVSVRLTHERSDVRTVRIEFEHPEVGNGSDYRLLLRPEAYVYWPQEVAKKPWLHDNVVDVYTYPRFGLTTEDDCPTTEADWAGRNVLVGFGSAEGTARLIQLFLDMSRAGSQVSEILLESEPGFRGVAPASSEIRFWLPGGFAWNDGWL